MIFSSPIFSKTESKFNIGKSAEEQDVHVSFMSVESILSMKNKQEFLQVNQISSVTERDIVESDRIYKIELKNEKTSEIGIIFVLNSAKFMKKYSLDSDVELRDIQEGITHIIGDEQGTRLLVTKISQVDKSRFYDLNTGFVLFMYDDIDNANLVFDIRAFSDSKFTLHESMTVIVI